MPTATPDQPDVSLKTTDGLISNIIGSIQSAVPTLRTNPTAESVSRIATAAASLEEAQDSEDALEAAYKFTTSWGRDEVSVAVAESVALPTALLAAEVVGAAIAPPIGVAAAILTYWGTSMGLSEVQEQFDSSVSETVSNFAHAVYNAVNTLPDDDEGDF